jgi:hypothetical protein
MKKMSFGSRVALAAFGGIAFTISLIMLKAACDPVTRHHLQKCFDNLVANW